MKEPFLLFFIFYTKRVAPIYKLLLGQKVACRFSPTCSVYTRQAIRKFGIVHGGILSLKRICRCHPWGSYGIDQVPNRL